MNPFDSQTNGMARTLHVSSSIAFGFRVSGGFFVDFKYLQLFRPKRYNVLNRSIDGFFGLKKKN